MLKELLGDIAGAICLIIIFAGFLFLPIIIPPEFLL